VAMAWSRQGGVSGRGTGRRTFAAALSPRDGDPSPDRRTSE
jgi:hypothetical protein